jgi:PQQ-dependent catabolism-associated CXXCW motif protein
VTDVHCPAPFVRRSTSRLSAAPHRTAARAALGGLLVLGLSSCGKAPDDLPPPQPGPPPVAYPSGPAFGPGAVPDGGAPSPYGSGLRADAPDPRMRREQNAEPVLDGGWERAVRPGTNASAQRQVSDPLEAWERQDFGVRPPSGLHDGDMHGPTPSSIPGGQVIATRGLIPLMQGAAGVQPVILQTIDGGQPLPNAIPATFAAASGDFNDQTHAQLGQLLRQATRGNREIPIVTYCAGPQCWMSYNAALRAIQLGFTNVLWYRGGMEAWTAAQQGQGGNGGSTQGQFQNPDAGHGWGPAPGPQGPQGQMPQTREYY